MIPRINNQYNSTLKYVLIQCIYVKALTAILKDNCISFLKLERLTESVVITFRHINTSKDALDLRREVSVIATHLDN